MLLFCYDSNWERMTESNLFARTVEKPSEDFGSSEISGGLALMSGFWGDFEKRGSKIIQGG